MVFGSADVSFPARSLLIPCSVLPLLLKTVDNYLMWIYCTKIAFFSKIGYFSKIAYFSKIGYFLKIAYSSKILLFYKLRLRNKLFSRNRRFSRNRLFSSSTSTTTIPTWWKLLFSKNRLFFEK